MLGLQHEAAQAQQQSGDTAGASGPSDAEIEAQIEARKAAKAARDFTTADGIREALKSQGIELIDKPGGLTEWLRG